MEAIWEFLSDPDNQTTLGFLGGGIAAAAGAIWAVFKFFRKGGKSGPSSVTVSADHGGVAAGRDVHMTQKQAKTEDE